jgi:hypothetical protein
MICITKGQKEVKTYPDQMIREYKFMNTDEIKDIFLSLRFLRAEQLLLKKKAEENPHAEDILKKLGFVSNQIQRAELWMKLLSDDEAYVLKRHLVDGIDIGRIAIEYKERWGEEFTKTERTLRSYQRRAFKRIQCFEAQRGLQGTEITTDSD